MVLVSAIITTFNRKEFFKQALSSVLQQTEKKFEILVLDNASTDGTNEYISAIKDSRLKYICHKAMGISAQRNLGVRLASGSYIAFLDDDDRWMPEKLHLQLNAFKNQSHKLALVYGEFEFYNDAGDRWGGSLLDRTVNYYDNLLWARDPFTGSASNPMLKKDLVQNVGGYNENVKVGEDWELYLRLAQKYEIKKINKKVLEIRQHTGKRLGDRVASALKTEIFVYRNHFSTMTRKHRSRFEQRIGGKLIRLNHPKFGRRMLKKAIATKKDNIFAWSQFFLSVLPIKYYNYFHKTYLKHLKRF